MTVAKKQPRLGVRFVAAHCGSGPSATCRFVQHFCQVARRSRCVKKCQCLLLVRWWRRGGRLQAKFVDLLLGQLTRAHNDNVLDGAIARRLLVFNLGDDVHALVSQHA